MSYRVALFKHKRSKKKYRNATCRYNGITYHSKFEAKVAQDLDIKIKLGEIERWERQVRIDLRAYGKHICFYFIDFLVYHTDGRKEYLEAKGYETPDWIIKWNLFEAMMKEQEPEVILTVVKEKWTRGDIGRVRI